MDTVQSVQARQPVRSLGGSTPEREDRQPGAKPGDFDVGLSGYCLLGPLAHLRICEGGHILQSYSFFAVFIGAGLAMSSLSLTLAVLTYCLFQL
jgi:hypothetical protein